MKSSTLLFKCQFGHFPRDAVHVLSVNSRGDGISQCYHYCISLSVPRHIDVDLLAPLPVKLFLYPETSTQVPKLVTQGHITRYEKENRGDPNHYHLTIWMESWLSKLSRVTHSRVFVDKTPEEITERILKENKIPPSYWRWHSSLAPAQAREPLPLLLQIQENDTDFLLRLWAAQGYAFLFEHTDTSTVLHITSVDMLPFVVSNDPQNNRITYYPQKGMTRQPNQAFDWAHALQADKMPVLTLTTLAQDLYPGMRIQFTEPNHTWLSGEYLIIQRTIMGEFRQVHAELDYSCTLALISVKTPFQLPKLSAPVYPGLRTAYIDHGDAADTEHSEAPNLDDAGRYWIRFPFDTTPIPASSGSNRVCFATPFGGSGYGWHFPLRAGTQVVLTLRETPEGGHEATIVGTLPDAQTPAPIDLKRPSCHRLRTHRENTFEADDHVNTGYTALFTQQRNNEVRLAANTRDNSILLKSTKQAIHLAAHQDINIESQQNIHIHAKQNLEENIDNTYTLLADQDTHFKTTDASIVCAKETRVLSKTDSKIDTAALRWSAQQTLSLTVSQQMHCWAKHCDLSAKNIEITATESPFILEQGAAQCHFDTSGSMGLYANQFLIEAPKISIYSGGEQNR